MGGSSATGRISRGVEGKVVEVWVGSSASLHISMGVEAWGGSSATRQISENTCVHE